MGFSRQEYWSGVPLPSPTIDPRAPKGWWPDALATGTLENSPSLQVSLLLASQEETSKCSLLDASAETALPGWDESEREG